MRYCILDIETTGLDPDKHAIVEICTRVCFFSETDRKLVEVVTTRHSVKPFEGAIIDPEAVAINGYKPDDTSEAFPNIWTEHFENLHGNVLVGHNVAFDRGFVLAACKRHRLQVPDMGHRTLDSCSIARFVNMVSGLEALTCSLMKTAQRHGISTSGSHTALGDVEMVHALLNQFLWRVRIQP